MDLPNWELVPATGGWRLGNRGWATEAQIRGWRMEAGGQRLRMETGRTHVYSPLACCSKMVFPLLLTLPS